MVSKLPIPEPFSGGLLLSYKCTNECKHCMYACSSKWKNDWISEKDAEGILNQLSSKFQGKYPSKSDTIGINYGVHFTGGEPFLNFDLLLKVTRMAHELQIPSTFVETNSFWCVDDETTREKLVQLKDAGLHGILVSVNPFILEQTPFERTERAIEISEETFDRNVIVYQPFFHHQFKRLSIRNTLPFEEYLQKIDLSGLHENIELLPMGRAPYKLGYLYLKYPAKAFFGQSCRKELTRPWHVHIDNYGNYIAGYCGGISLGDARDLDSICSGVDLEERPILDALVTDLERLYEFGVKEFGYEERKEGYVSKCHLCADVRRHIAQRTSELKELRPREFYYHFE